MSYCIIFLLFNFSYYDYLRKCLGSCWDFCFILSLRSCNSGTRGNFCLHVLSNEILERAGILIWPPLSRWNSGTRQHISDLTGEDVSELSEARSNTHPFKFQRRTGGGRSNKSSLQVLDLSGGGSNKKFQKTKSSKPQEEIEQNPLHVPNLSGWSNKTLDVSDFSERLIKNPSAEPRFLFLLVRGRKVHLFCLKHIPFWPNWRKSVLNETLAFTYVQKYLHMMRRFCKVWDFRFLSCIFF